MVASRKSSVYVCVLGVCVCVYRAYKKLPEVLRAVDDKKRQQEYKTNRLRAQLYQKVGTRCGRCAQGAGGVHRVRVVCTMCVSGACRSCEGNSVVVEEIISFT